MMRMYIYKWVFMTLGLVFGVWTGVIIFLHYDPSRDSYTGVDVPTMYWQLGAGIGIMSAIWALINFLIHKNNMGERIAWSMSGFFGAIFCLLYMTIIIYMYVVKKAWGGFTDDVKATFDANLMSQAFILEKIPIFGAFVSWFFAALLGLSLAGCCCFQGEFY